MRYFVVFIFAMFHFASFCQFDNPEKLTTTTLINVQGYEINDFDNDNKKDLMVAGQINMSGGMAWFHYDGNDNFQYRDPVIDFSPYSSVVSLDIDDDGDLDAIGGHLQRLKISYNFNNGEFTEFETLFELTGVGNIKKIVTSDVENDGDDDVIVLSQLSTGEYFLNLLRNNGNSSFSLPELILGSFSPQKILCFDIDNDNDNDLIIQQSISMKIVLNDGLGNFSSNSTVISVSESIYDFEILDYNGDGFFEFVLSTDYGLKLYLNQGGVFVFDHILWSNGTLLDITAKDIDQDGDIDFAGNVSNNHLVWIENATICIEHVISNIINPEYVELEDINGDGFPDLIGINSCVYFSNSGGNFNSPNPISPQHSGSFTIGDINNDGHGDIVFALPNISNNNGYGVFAMYSDSMGSYSAPIKLMENYLQYISLYDLDLDGRLDIISSNSIYKNNGDSTFTNLINFSISGEQAKFFLDYNLDGDIDYFIDNNLYTTLVKNLGSNSFSTTNFNSAAFNTSLEYMMDDINLDGNLDFITANTQGLYYNYFNANGTMQTLYQTLINAPLSDCRFIDMDDDGDLDALVGTNGNLGWYKNNLNTGGMFSSLNVIGNFPGQTIKSIRIVDVDLDNDDDIFFCFTPGSLSNPILFYENQGNQNYILHSFLPPAIESANQIEFLDSDDDSDFDLIVSGGSGIFKLNNLHINPYQAKGNLFYDYNQDGIKNGLDYGMNLVKVKSTPTQQFAFTNIQGNFRFNFDPSLPGNYILLPELESSAWTYSIGGNGYPINVNGPILNADTLDFGVFPLTEVDSFSVDLSGGFPRCNSIVNYYVGVRNLGTTNSLIQLDLDLSPSLTFVNASILPDSILGTHYYWHFDSINCFGLRNFNIQVEFPDFSFQGNVLSSLLNLKAIHNDTVSFTKTDTLLQTVVCAYDPNDKVGFPIGEGSEGYISQNQEYLEYLVRFQNTGNDTAINITIHDFIDTNLIFPEVEILAASHDLNVEINGSNEIRFVFNNILLPDSATNSNGSKGFVKYRIPIHGNLFYGTKIKNTAYIYFDYNPAIATNSTIHTIERPATYNSLLDTVCGIYVSPSGNFTLTNSGIISDTLLNWYQGDSILTIDVVIIDLPVVSMINDTTLSVFGGNNNTNWQWMYCDSSIIIGENSNLLNVISNGNYSVIMTNNYCVDTSSCFTFSVNDVFNFNEELSIFPNPFINEFKINSSLSFSHLKILSNQGEIMEERFFSSTHDLNYRFNGADGVYFLQIEFDNSESKILKLIRITN